jgi:hypothetical protein
MTSLLLGIKYYTWDLIGHYSAYTIMIIGFIIWFWIMYRYLNSSDLND